MNYEEKYRKLLDAIKVMLEANPHDEGLQNWVHDNVPELTESEDIRIRESAIKLLRRIDSAMKWSQDGYTLGDIIAWLEKQGNIDLEVDLEKEFYSFLNTLIYKDNGHLSEDELFSIAKHFFELGLKAKGN
jgi:hypothetical protein